MLSVLNGNRLYLVDIAICGEHIGQSIMHAYIRVEYVLCELGQAGTVPRTLSMHMTCHRVQVEKHSHRFKQNIYRQIIVS